MNEHVLVKIEAERFVRCIRHAGREVREFVDLEEDLTHSPRASENEETEAAFLPPADPHAPRQGCILGSKHWTRRLVCLSFGLWTASCMHSRSLAYHGRRRHSLHRHRRA